MRRHKQSITALFAVEHTAEALPWVKTVHGWHSTVDWVGSCSFLCLFSLLPALRGRSCYSSCQDKTGVQTGKRVTNRASSRVRQEEPPRCKMFVIKPGARNIGHIKSMYWLLRECHHQPSDSQSLFNIQGYATRPMTHQHQPLGLFPAPWGAFFWLCCSTLISDQLLCVREMTTTCVYCSPVLSV